MKKIFLLLVIFNINCSKQNNKLTEQVFKYDDASWHYGNDYPKDLTQENASTHIGMYLKWCIHHNLISSELIEDTKDGIDDVKSNRITGAIFLIKYSDGKFLDSDLNEIGKNFTKDYYENDSKFSKMYGSYLDDYTNLFQKIIDNKSVYHVEDSELNYLLIKEKIDKKFEIWKNFESK